uniref:Ubiquitin E3 ligase ICP0 n=1 Tax=Human herpesvirus 2 TaxID=10310 RepID=A0A0Y0RBG0_HHV2|nr:ubiquitin E3 ligase ICP0 [Human alphaherpesvirus 2]
MEPRPGTSSRADPGPERPPRQTPGTVRGRPPGLRPPLFPGPPGCGLGVVAGGGDGPGPRRRRTRAPPPPPPPPPRVRRLRGPGPGPGPELGPRAPGTVR